jgi:hypothetical protein
MYAGSDHPAWRSPGPGQPATPVPDGRVPARRLGLLLALLLFPLTAGVLTGAAVPLVLALDPAAGWNELGLATFLALLLAAPAAHGLAAILLRTRADPHSATPKQRD